MNTYSVELGERIGKEFFPDDHSKLTVFAENRSKAKGKAFSIYTNDWEIEWYEGFMGFARNCRVLKIGEYNIKDRFQDVDQFNRVIKNRGIDFAYQGMTVKVGERKGIIIGGNDSMNLQVYFEDIGSNNCHPWSHITYYDSSGNIIKEYAS